MLLHHCWIWVLAVIRVKWTILTVTLKKKKIDNHFNYDLAVDCHHPCSSLVIWVSLCIKFYLCYHSIEYYTFGLNCLSFLVGIYVGTLEWKQELNYSLSSKNCLRRMLKISFRYLTWSYKISNCYVIMWTLNEKIFIMNAGM